MSNRPEHKRSCNFTEMLDLLLLLFFVFFFFSCEYFVCCPFIDQRTRSDRRTNEVIFFFQAETDESVTDGKMEGYLYRKPTMDAPNRKAPIR